MVRPLSARQLHLPGKPKDNWEDQMLEYFGTVFAIMDILPHEDNLASYNEELAATLGGLARFEYLARVERDRSMAEGYSRFPKGQYNSAEQEARARAYAGPADRLHKLLKETSDAIRTRISVGQNKVNYLRTQIESLQ